VFKTQRLSPIRERQARAENSQSRRRERGGGNAPMADFQDNISYVRKWSPARAKMKWRSG